MSKSEAFGVRRQNAVSGSERSGDAALGGAERRGGGLACCAKAVSPLRSLTLTPFCHRTPKRVTLPLAAPLLLSALLVMLPLSTRAETETVQTSRGAVTLLFNTDSSAAALPDRVTEKYYTYAYFNGNPTATVSTFPNQLVAQPSGSFTREPADLRALMKEPEKLALIFIENNPHATPAEKKEKKQPEKKTEEKKVAGGVTKKPKEKPLKDDPAQWMKKTEVVETPRGLVRVEIESDEATATLADNETGKIYQYVHRRGEKGARVVVFADGRDEFNIVDGFKCAPKNLHELLKKPGALAKIFEGAGEQRRPGNRVTGGIILEGKLEMVYEPDRGDVSQHFCYNNATLEHSASNIAVLSMASHKSYSWTLYDKDWRKIDRHSSESLSTMHRVAKMQSGTRPEGYVENPKNGKSVRGYTLTVFDPKTGDRLREYVVWVAEPMGIEDVFRIPCGDILWAGEYNPATGQLEGIPIDKYVKEDFPGM